MAKKDINAVTLTIRDKSLREKFEEMELDGVKRRWEIFTAFLVGMFILSSIFKISDPEKLLLDII